MAIDFNNPDPEALMQALRMAGLTADQAGYIAGIAPAQRAAAFNAYADQMVNQIGASDLAAYAGQRSSLQDAYKQGLARLDYQQGAADQNYATGRGNLVRQYDQMRQKLPYRYNARGLMNSGVYQQGLQDYGDARLRSLNEYQQRYQQQQGDYALQKNQVNSSYRTGMSNVDQLEKARRAQLAAQIKAAQ